MTDEERELEAEHDAWLQKGREEQRQLDELLFEIEQAKHILEQHGYTVLEWQTGEPEEKRKVIMLTKSGSYHTVIREQGINRVIADTKLFLKDLNVDKWAYLPEGEQK